jgi:hypothetical protein
MCKIITCGTVCLGVFRDSERPDVCVASFLVSVLSRELIAGTKVLTFDEFGSSDFSADVVISFEAFVTRLLVSFKLTEREGAVCICCICRSPEVGN